MACDVLSRVIVNQITISEEVCSGWHTSYHTPGCISQLKVILEAEVQGHSASRDFSSDSSSHCLVSAPLFPVHPQGIPTILDLIGTTSLKPLSPFTATF